MLLLHSSGTVRHAITFSLGLILIGIMVVSVQKPISYSANAALCSTIPLTNASATSSQSGFPASYALDGSLSTRWSASKATATIQASLLNTKDICSMSIAWYKGNTLKYTFEIDLSSDGSSWSKAYAGVSSGSTASFETYSFQPIIAKFVRVMATTGSANKTPSISEMTLSGYNVPDTTPPAVSISSPISGNYLNTVTPAIKGTAYDNAALSSVQVSIDGVPYALASGTSSWSYTTASLSQGAHTVYAKATDTSGLVSTVASTAFTVDTVAPTIVVPSSLKVSANATSAVVAYAVTATDSISGSSVPVCSPASGSAFAIGTTLVSCNAKDTAGNTATANFTITVQDTTPPTLLLPGPITAAANSSSGSSVTYNATATDLVSGSVPVACAPPSGSTFAITTTTVKCSATDGNGNTATGTFNVTVTAPPTPPSTPPTLHLPSSITTQAISPSGAAINYNATANDYTGLIIPVNCNPPSGSTFAITITTVNCTATDSYGNTTSGNFTVSVVDTTAPAISVPPALTVQANNSAGAVVSYTVTATDNVGVISGPTCTPVTGSSFSLGTTTITCTASDSAANTATASFNVTVQDPPTNPLPTSNTNLYDDFSGNGYSLSGGQLSPNGRWHDVYNGYGSSGVQVDSQNATNSVYYEYPQTSAKSSTTHADLTISTQTFHNYKLSLDMRTDKQLRTGSSPNNWENAWIMFNYVDNYHHYYFTLKNSGAELGKKDNNLQLDQQVFLATPSSPSVTHGQRQHVDITIVNNLITVYVNGIQVANVTDTTQSSMLGAGGNIGLYNEDSAVSFDNVYVTPLP